ncbi:MAG: hypothetical protein FJX52_08595 [Alphaproteobacteria bacterium]|nr:hypothetical protein [Alphaproteobacteria bacterium]
MASARGTSAPVMFMAGRAIAARLPAGSPLRRFLDYHISIDFFRHVVELFGAHIARMHPAIETRLGKPLSAATVTWRGAADAADIVLDCQLGFNPPAPRSSRVRGVHIDKRRRLFSALLYCRYDDDDDGGGDLGIYRFKPGAGFADEIGAPDSAVDLVATVPYRANSLFFFVNSAKSLHGVMARPASHRPRRHLNFFAELHEDFIAT